MPVTPEQITEAFGVDNLGTIGAQTGEDADQVAARLAAELPDAINQLSPEGTFTKDPDLIRVVARSSSVSIYGIVDSGITFSNK